MAEERERLQEDEPILVGGTEELPQEDADEQDEDAQDEAALSDDDTDEEESDDDASDDEDEEPGDKPEPKNLRSLLDDDDVQMLIDDMQEGIEIAEYDTSLAEKGDAKTVEAWGFKQYPLTNAQTGRSINIYAQNDHEFDNTLALLEQTDGVSNTFIREVVKAKAKYDAKVEIFKQSQQAKVNQCHAEQWAIIADKAPRKVKDNADAIRDWITRKAENDPSLQRRAETFKGKLALVNMALKEIKPTGTVEKKERPTPAIHKAKPKGNATRGTAQRRFKSSKELGQWVADLSKAEYAKNRDVIRRETERLSKK